MPSPSSSFIWVRCGGRKFPLFIFTPNDKVCVETRWFRADVKSSFYCSSLGGAAWVQFSALLRVSLGDNGVLRSLGCYCIAVLDKALKTVKQNKQRWPGNTIQVGIASGAAPTPPTPDSLISSLWCGAQKAKAFLIHSVFYPNFTFYFNVNSTG